MAPMNGTQTAKNCTDPAIHEFPTDLFSNKERQHGAVLLHILGALYMFYALAIVCDDFFVPSLEKICEVRRRDLGSLSKAGVRVEGCIMGVLEPVPQSMGLGTRASQQPGSEEVYAQEDFCLSLPGVFITHGDVGVGTIVGSAVFNILCIIGVCGLFAGQVVRLTWWAVCRDSVYYTLSVIVLIAFIYDEEIVWWEGLVLIILYVFYILIMKYNVKMQAFFTIKQKTIANGNTVSSELEDGNDYCDTSSDDPSLPLLGQGKAEQTGVAKSPPGSHFGSHIFIHWLLRDPSVGPPASKTGASPFCEPSGPGDLFARVWDVWGLKSVLVGPLASPYSRVDPGSAPSPGLQRQRLINSANGVSSKPLQNGRHESIENGNVPVENPEDPQRQQEQQPPPPPPPPEPEPVEAAFLSPFSVPEARGDKAKWVFTWPLIFLLCVTIPNCSKPRWEKYFMVTFITATLWIAVFSYLMVWLVTIIGYTLGIPDVIMGITFLAAGTSVPDCMASLIVARQGLGDMAVSNTIGSNVFDILVGLGIPWGLQTMVINYGSTVKINSRGLVYSVVLLLGSVALTVLGIHLNKWRLDRKLGVCVLALYAVFLCFSIMIEFNVFTFVNLPMCREDD
ncbi:sodium/potassium/calcium exchanger 4 [Puma concolor]|uniref:Sodium/potassium/calcium exchanger 4 n=1 Tax=Puma concolor TaxID=9696 RepID=A0A6P6HIB5_PUMCO|nr:sodium/potassium/calcium exchanger 4 [Puma concolor]